MTSIPDITLNNGSDHPAAGLRRLPDRAGGHRGRGRPPRSRSGTGTSTPPRCTATRSEVGEAIAESDLDRGRGLRHQQAEQRLPRPDDALRAFDQTLGDLGIDYVDLFLIHWPLPRYGGDFVETWRALEEFYARRPGPGDRRVQLPAAPPAAAARGDHSHPGGQPDRGAPVPDPGRAAGVLRRARDRHRGLVADRAGRRARRPGDHRIAERTGKSPAQVVLRWHIQLGNIVFPKSMTAGPDPGELRDLRLRAVRRGRRAISALNKDERTGPDPDEFDGR